MKFFGTAFLLHCKRIFRNTGALAVMGLLPLTMLVCGLYMGQSREVVAIRVAVAFDPENAYAAAVFGSLPQDRGITFLAYPADARAELEELVKTGRVECAYLLPDGLEEQLRTAGSQEGIILLKSPQTVADLFAGDMLFASMLTAGSEEIATAYLAETLERPPEEVRPEIARRFAAYRQEEGRFMHPDEDGLQVKESPGPPPAQGSRALHGIAALFLLCATGFFLPSYITEKHSLLTRLKSSQRLSYYFSLFASLWLLESVLGALSLGLAGAVFPRGLAPMGQELPALLCYTAAVSMAGLLLICLLQTDSLVYPGTVLLLITSVVLGGVLFDAGEVSRLLGSISRLFPSTGYIGAVLYGAAGPLLPLAVLFLLSLAGVLLLLLSGRGSSRR